ncbi:MAG: hypothetical protein GXO91_00565 [FCB group bacterium]|nr:hypothetical protein [FCB group bacterium]
MQLQNNKTGIDPAREWQAKLAILTTGLLIFETLTGLGIYLLPFSIPLQITVLIHTLVGLIFIIPFTVYQIRHWLLYRKAAMTHVKLTGYLAMGAAVICSISGVVLTWQAVFGLRIGKGWDMAHLISTFAIIILTLPHIVTLVLRVRAARDKEKQAKVLDAQKIFGWGTVLVTILPIAVIALWSYAYEPVNFNNNFPEDYNFTHGEDEPFLPSLAKTNDGKAIDSRALSGSLACGSTRCHEEIVAEWQPSAHRYSALDAAFQTVQSVMGKQNGYESTRYCGGCHDPISLFSGTKNIFVEDLTSLAGYQEGVSCLVCHAIKETDIKGNANYVITQPIRYAYELTDSKSGKLLSDFLIRAYPQQHIESLSHRLFKSPEFCAACHKQFIDAEINKVGWVQLQNQYDNWRKSRWNHSGDPTRTIECRECHMPLIADSSEPGSGDELDYNRSPGDKKHRSHRFLGANQLMPTLLKLDGGEEQVEMIEKWLRGEVDIPEIADKWVQGPAVPIELNSPTEAEAGSDIDLQVVITNNKTGHDFPTGPLDIIQAWIEILVKNEAGDIVFESGTRDENHFIQPGSFIFKAEAVDESGNLIDRHNLWEMVGVRYKRTLFPGFSDMAEYTFTCPGSASASDENKGLNKSFQFTVPDKGNQKLFVEAKLQYRKIDQYLLNFLYGEDSGLTSPVTTISESNAVIDVKWPDYSEAEGR